MSASQQCTDHLGNVFRSKKERAKYWNMKVGTINNRLREGKSLEYALTAPLYVSNSNRCEDHLGNEFKSEKERAEYWGLSDSAVREREKNKDLNLQEILTTPLYSRINDECEDHLGNKFKSKKERAEYWRVPAGAVSRRLKEGKSLEYALTTPTRECSHSCYDHLGNEFKSETERARYWNISANTVHDRLNQGKTLEEALTMNQVKNDPFGNEFKSLVDMCKFYNVNIKAARYKIYNNYSLPVALDISFQLNSRIINFNQTKYDLTVVKRITKGKDVFECYIDNGDGTSTFRIMTYEMIDQYCLEQYKKLHNTKEEK